MAFDPTDLYDQNIGTNDDPPPLPEGFIVGPSRTPSYVAGNVRNYDPSKYTGYLTEGVFENKGDINLQRGAAQSNWDQFGNALMQTGVKVGTGLIDMVGSIGALATEWGDNRDYSNAVTDIAEAGNKWVSEQFPIFREESGTFGWTDSGWWFQNAADLTSSVGSFAIGGMGIAKGLGAVGKMARIGKTVKDGLYLAGLGGREAIAATQFLERGVTAGLLAYTEGAMSGREVFRNVYQYHLNNGMDEVSARHLAAQSAASTTQLSTMLNTAMNLVGGVGMFFNHERNAIEKVAAKVLKETEQEAGGLAKGNFLKAFKERVSKMDLTKEYARELGMDYGIQTMGKKGLTVLREAVAEGLEETNTLFAEKAGTEQGKQGKTKGLMSQLQLLEDYGKHTFNEEGALNFMLGAVAGPVQNTIAAALPMHKVPMGGYARNDKNELIDAAGNVVTDARQAAINYYNQGKRVTAAKKNRLMAENQFGDIKKQIMDDFEFLENTQKKIVEHLEKGEVNEAKALRDSMFQAHQMKSVRMGMGEVLKNTYQSIAGLDNEVTEKDEIGEKLKGAKQSLAQVQAEGGDTTQIETEVKDLELKLQAVSDKTLAMKLGFASEVGDTDYKKKAEKAIRMIDMAQRNYDRAQKMFGTEDLISTDEEKHLADFMFQLFTDRDYAKEDLAEIDAELAAKTAPFNEYLFDTYAEQHKASSDMARNIRNANLTAAKLQADVDEINRLSQVGTIDARANMEALFEKYGVMVMEGETMQSAADRVVKIMEQIRDEQIDKGKENLRSITESEHYRAWADDEANKGKKMEDYYKSLQLDMRTTLDHEQLMDRKAQTEAKIKLLEANIQEVTKRNTLTALQKNAEDFYKKLEKKLIDLQKATIEKRTSDRVNRNAAIRYNEEQKKKLIHEYTLKAKELGDQIKAIQDKIRQLNEENRSLQDKMADKASLRDNKLSFSALNSRVTENLKEMDKLSKEAAKLAEEVESYLRYIDTLDNSVAPVSYEDMVNYWSSTTPPPPPPPPSSTPPPPPPPVTVLEQKTQAFNAAFDSMTQDQQDQAAGILAQAGADKKYSLGLLVPIGLTSDESAKVVTAWKELMEARGAVLQEIAEEAGVAAVAAQAAESTELPELDLEGEKNFSYHDDPGESEELENVNPSDLSPEDSGGLMVGAKIVEAASTGASQSLSFDLAVGDLETEQKGKTFAGKKQSPESMRPETLKKGTEVKVVLDVEFDGEVIDHSQVESGKMRSTSGVAQRKKKLKASSFMNPDGTIQLTEEAIDNFPLQIQNTDGTPTGQYIRTVPWVLAQDPKAFDPKERYLNVADVIPDAEGNPIPGNAEAQAQQLRRFRRSVLEAYNRAVENQTAPAFHVPFQVLSKGSGSFIRLKQMETAYTHLKESRLIGGQEEITTMTLGLVSAGSIRGLDNNVEVLGSVVKLSDKQIAALDNRVVALVPMANGKRIPQALLGTPLLSKEDPVAYESMKRAIEVYLSKDDKGAEAIRGLTGGAFDVSKVDGLRLFLAQYYIHTDSANSLGKGFKIVVSQGAVNVYFNGTTSEQITLQLKDGVLTEESDAALRTLASKRYRSVAIAGTRKGLKGLGTKEKFVEVRYNRKNKTWLVREHESYDAYILKYLKTDITYAKKDRSTSKQGIPYTDAKGNQRSGFFYGANPVTTYNFAPVTPAPRIKEESLLADPKASILAQQAEADARKYGVDEDAPLLQDEEETAQVGETNLMDLRKGLEELLKFVPESDRNGRTLAEVEAELTLRGLTQIDPKTFQNPFTSRCL